MFVALRSVPLSKETRDAWRKHGVVLVKRANYSGQHVRKLISANEGRGCLNLGVTNFDFSVFDVPVFNSVHLVRNISHPLAARRTLDDWLPEPNQVGPHWHKNGGWGGRGAVYHEQQVRECPSLRGDVQAHIYGKEYRVVTVGNTVVQAAEKVDVKWSEGKHSFTYKWVGVQGINTTGIVPYLKDAIAAIPDREFSVLGWDVMHDGNRPFVLEVNTSPGVNEATAQRVVKQMERIVG